MFDKHYNYIIAFRVIQVANTCQQIHSRLGLPNTNAIIVICYIRKN